MNIDTRTINNFLSDSEIELPVLLKINLLLL